MTSVIAGLGTTYPAHRITQRVAAEMAVARCGGDERTREVVRRLYRRTTIAGRGSCLARHADDDLAWFYPPATNGERGPTTAARMTLFCRHAPTFAVEAGRRALAASRVDATSITHLVTVTCTGFAAPCVEVELIERLGLPADVKRVQIGFMGCHAALNALQVAAAHVDANSRATVLVCSVELCSLHYQLGGRASNLVSNALFADGAAAAVVRAGDGEWRIASTTSRLLDGTTEAMTWRIGDHGFEMELSPQVPSLIAARLRPWIDDWLGRHGLRLADIAGWAIHAGGPRIVDAVSDRLELPDDATAVSRAILAEYGNMSSATVLFILQRLRERPALPCVALSFGPGLMAEAALFVDT